MKQLLRTIDRWRFEAPLALLLAAACCFAMAVMPRDLIGRVPVAGGLGATGQLGLAMLVAALLGLVAYAAMRKPRVVAAPEPEIETEEEDEPVSPDRLRRLRRADAHPDAPPREPIRASRDLGEPFMEIGTADSMIDSEAWHADPIPAGDFVEIDAAAVATEAWIDEVLPAEPRESEPVDPEQPVDALPEAPVAIAPEPAVTVVDPAAGELPAITPPVRADAITQTAPRARRESIPEMLERLSSGLARRAAMPAPVAAPAAPLRDMRPALREALDELNRLAARRG